MRVLLYVCYILYKKGNIFMFIIYIEREFMNGGVFMADYCIYVHMYI